MKLLTLILFLPLASLAQGTFQFVWHGNSNYFQSSFIVTDAEMQPGATFSSPDFTNAVQVDSLSGFTYNAKDTEYSFLGGLNPWGFHLTFVNFNTSMEVLVSSLGFPYTGMAGYIEEKPMFGTDLYFETGYWTYTAIPEPPVAAISVLGAGILFLRRRAIHR